MLFLLLRKLKSLGISLLRKTSLHSCLGALLLTLVRIITGQRAVDHHPIGIVPNGESAPFPGMPHAHGGHEKAGKGEGFKESLCCQKLQLQMFGKTFFKGLEQGANYKN